MKYFILILAFFALITQPLAARQKPKLAGHWKGRVYGKVLGNKTQFNIKTDFNYQKRQYDGKIIIQGHPLSLKNIQVTKDDSVLFYFDGGGKGKAYFKGTFQNDSLITGDYSQGGYHLKFKLKKYTPKKEKAIPKPYNHKDLIIKNDSIKIGGTLTWPKKGKAHQLVIMMTGSGAQKRNENAFGFKIFGQLADYLTRHGIATFRYDDRGVGKSTGNFRQSGLDKLSSDVEAIIIHFTKAPRHNFNSIDLLGHSQGGYIGARVAAQDSLVDKLILMSSPATSLSKIVVAQDSVEGKEAGLSSSKIAKNLKLQRAIFDTLRYSENVTKLEDKLVKNGLKDFSQQPDSIQSQNKNPEKYFRKKYHQTLKYMASPSYFSFLDYKPAKDLSKLDIPVLALFGGKDTQVLISQNRPPMQAALDSAGVSYQINVFKNANHLYQKAKTGSVQEYSTLPKKFVRGFLPTIEEWLKRTSGK